MSGDESAGTVGCIMLMAGALVMAVLVVVVLAGAAAKLWGLT